MLNKIFALIVSTAMCLSLLSGCSEAETANVVMPDIVFVIFFHYPEEIEYVTGTFIGTAGYYIDKNGEIKYFEFEDKEEPAFDYEKEYITMEEYSDLRKLDELTEKIKENSFDTDFDAIQKEKLISYYKKLLKIDPKNKLENTKNSLNAVFGLTCFYGVRINGNNEKEYLVAHEYGDFYYSFINNNYNVENLYKQLSEVFPEIEIHSFENKENKLRQ
ncbi:MAG: hypothetical protein ACI4J6_07330 [Oscillospiraceae bacterium]